MICVHLNNSSNNTLPPSLAEFKGWITHALAPNTEATITLVLLTPTEIARINQAHRGRLAPTNVLSFCYQQNPLVGELLFCPNIIQSEAEEQQISLTAHWAHLTIHGILHLLGYDHETETDANHMENQEIRLLHTLGIDNPYID